MFGIWSLDAEMLYGYNVGQLVGFFRHIGAGGFMREILDCHLVISSSVGFS